MEQNDFQDALLFSSVECSMHTTDWEGFPVASHWHYFAEIIRVCSGSLEVTAGDSSYTLTAGDSLFIIPLKTHSLNHADSESPATYEVIRLDMQQFGDLPSYSPDLRGMVLEADRRGFPMLMTAQEMREIHADTLIDQCVQEYRNRAYGYDLRIRAMLFLVFTAVIRRWISLGFVPQNYAPRIEPIYTLPSYIAHHIKEPLKVEDLAEYCGLSYPWFARKFHQIYGISCKEYIEKVRIRRVEHYLMFTDCDLNYISQNTGYSDCSHLVRDFRKLRNTTPGQFRQACRQKLQSKSQFPQNY